MKPSIVIIDDERDITESLKLLFEENDYDVDTFKSAEEFFSSKRPENQCVYLIDWNLPGMQGTDIVRHIRNKDMISSVFMISAFNQSRQVLEGLESGADDYITKPFDINELMIKVQNAHAKISSLRKNLMNVGLKLIPEAHTVIKDGVAVNLTAREYIIFEHLYENLNLPQTREELINRFDNDLEMTSRNIDVHVFALRKKISKANIQIQTVWGTGYKLSL
jgi:two-component system, OmpR family, alkaline phosphatase synthesis response regulator PhoP